MFRVIKIIHSLCAIDRFKIVRKESQDGGVRHEIELHLLHPVFPIDVADVLVNAGYTPLSDGTNFTIYHRYNRPTARGTAPKYHLKISPDKKKFTLARVGKRNGRFERVSITRVERALLPIKISKQLGAKRE